MIIYSFFENGIGPPPQEPNIIVANSNTIIAEITVKSTGSSKIRYWDIRVTNTVSSKGVLGEGFIIQP